MTATNSAARLLEILTQMRSRAGLGESLTDAWVNVLDVGTADSVEFQVARSTVSTLIGDLHRDILSLQGSATVSVHESNLRRWARIINMPPKASSAAFDANEVASEDELALLSGLSDLLNMMVPEVEPSSDAIADLLTQTRLGSLLDLHRVRGLLTCGFVCGDG